MDSAIPRCRSLLFFLLCSSLHFIFGLCDDSPGSKDGSKSEADVNNTSSIIVIVLIVLVVLSLLSFLLFKLWRKKKREEQYARLLKLFEEDDELELELGLRD
ncbi:hypothetical protein TanjilG_07939 [Lupinus angustifolius]|uniref:Uncharacterized protein n=1 Tax=Lupinus angustifolius TaxID=3871 RepID=A0A4P1RLZ4_LUPAN|nr:PREDICTED: uncharacterized protein LOC109345713 [Lupinus angustifolius]OIW13597.1 hypothetical protein TanjilG_07939 [Lupinus angustifolius]